mmetsp:Transcript_20052/g.47752  ORF Transcript_20052/g.47752 Transcript_20052/m.47752 type:complete len:268 (-) Transcript_20052:8-811(-)
MKAAYCGQAKPTSILTSKPKTFCPPTWKCGKTSLIKEHSNNARNASETERRSSMKITISTCAVPTKQDSRLRPTNSAVDSCARTMHAIMKTTMPRCLPLKEPPWTPQLQLFKHFIATRKTTRRPNTTQPWRTQTSLQRAMFRRGKSKTQTETILRKATQWRLKSAAKPTRQLLQPQVLALHTINSHRYSLQSKFLLLLLAACQQRQHLRQQLQEKERRRRRARALMLMLWRLHRFCQRGWIRAMRRRAAVRSCRSFLSTSSRSARGG